MADTGYVMEIEIKDTIKLEKGSLNFQFLSRDLKTPLS